MLGSLPSSSIKLTFFFLKINIFIHLQHVIKYGLVRTSRKTKIMGHGMQQLFKRQQENPDSTRFGVLCNIWNSLLQTRCVSSLLHGI